jgi:DNA-directed RNA polymerase specialized sigma24 family protein
MKQWTLSQSSFDNFLTVLDPMNRERAGQKYEALRTRLVKFFEWRACQFADDLADETLDRVMKKTDAGEPIKDHLNYAYGVARLVYLETLKQQNKQQAAVISMPVKNAAPEADEADSRLDCLEICLRQLSEDSRLMILHYYRDDKQAKIDYRKKLAEKFGLSPNALRIKTLRIRARLEECVFKCLHGKN